MTPYVSPGRVQNPPFSTLSSPMSTSSEAMAMPSLSSYPSSLPSQLTSYYPTSLPSQLAPYYPSPVYNPPQDILNVPRVDPDYPDTTEQQ